MEKLFDSAKQIPKGVKKSVSLSEKLTADQFMKWRKTMQQDDTEVKPGKKDDTNVPDRSSGEEKNLPGGRGGGRGLGRGGGKGRRDGSGGGKGRGGGGKGGRRGL